MLGLQIRKGVRPMEATRNLCAQIPVSLHDRVREERESQGQSLSEYVTQILKEHFEGGRLSAIPDRKMPCPLSRDRAELRGICPVVLSGGGRK